MIDNIDKLYLGRIYDPQKGQVTDEPYLYSLDDLTTHAVVVGMTGSGKTGLCIDLLEEAALRNIPALMIDPKGDITNILLHFPDLSPQDFLPWINADKARREGQTLDQAAIDAAALWKKGLADWGIEPERLRALKEAAHFAVYTPGSNAGIPVSILSSLKSPGLDWQENSEVLREKISSTVTALLGLVGLTDIDPVRSREHILLSHIFETAWSQGHDLDLGELIMQTQSPPFTKLGVFEVNAFFPQKDRFELAMALNNILAAPSFQTWIEGQPLDIPALLFGPDGRPRHSVFYIAHLSDAERMFFVTLLYSAVEAWMRTQSGTSSLRALVYFDEIFGYVPPIGNPPSKPPILRMLKQARAFGVGMVLVTQNPVDLDYKGLSNTGTWMVGKLQADRDKQRLLDGLEGAMAGEMNRAAYDKMISSLGKRVFLVHNVHMPANKAGQLFQTRWAMNYLAGPLARTQIPALNQLVGASFSAETAPSPAARPTTPPAAAEADTQPVRVRPGQGQPAPASPAVAPPIVSGERFTTTRPAMASGVAEYILANNLTFSQALKASGRAPLSAGAAVQVIYRPALLAQASLRFLDRRMNLDYEMQLTSLVVRPDRRGIVRWEEHQASPVDPRALDEPPAQGATYAELGAPLNDAKLITALKKDFLDWASRTGRVTVRTNKLLGVSAGPQTTAAAFRQMCSEAAREKRDAELKKVSDSYDKKLEALKLKIDREKRELAQDKAELSSRKLEEMGTHAQNLLGLFGKRSSRRLTSSLTKRRLTAQAEADLRESEDALEEMGKQFEKLSKEKEQALQEIQQRWGEAVNQIEEVIVNVLKKDILLDAFGVAWMPFYLVKTDGDTLELPGYSAA